MVRTATPYTLSPGIGQQVTLDIADYDRYRMLASNQLTIVKAGLWNVRGFAGGSNWAFNSASNSLGVSVVVNGTTRFQKTAPAYNATFVLPDIAYCDTGYQALSLAAGDVIKLVADTVNANLTGFIGKLEAVWIN